MQFQAEFANKGFGAVALKKKSFYTIRHKRWIEDVDPRYRGCWACHQRTLLDMA